MSIGVIFGRKPISGSCGGVGNQIGGSGGGCSVCGRESGTCDDDASDEGATTPGRAGDAAHLAYNAGTAGNDDRT